MPQPLSWRDRPLHRQLSTAPESSHRPQPSLGYATLKPQPPCGAPLQASFRLSRTPENRGSSRRNRTYGPYADMRCTPRPCSVAETGISIISPRPVSVCFSGFLSECPFSDEAPSRGLFCRVLELFVAAHLLHLEPAIPFKFSDNIAAIQSAFLTL